MDALQEYLTVWRAGGDEAVAIRWPEDPFVTQVPPSREFLARRVAVETCRFLAGCQCRGDASCQRPTRPASLPRGTRWPAVRWADCLRCTAADEHSPRGG